MAKRYVLTNQKGGVSKSQMSLTSAVMSWLCGKKVLLVDLDPQSNITLSSGCNPNALPATIYDVMRGQATAQDVLREIHFDPATSIFFDPKDELAMKRRGLASMPANAIKSYDLFPINLNAGEADVELQSDPEWGWLVDYILREYDHLYDEVFIDTNPGLGKLTMNGIVAATDIVIPLVADEWATQGMIRLATSITRAQRMKPELRVAGILFTRYRYKNHREVMEDVKGVLVEEINKQFPQLGLSWFETIIEEGAPFGEALNAHSNLMITHPETVFAVECFAYYVELLKRTNGTGIETATQKAQQLYKYYQGEKRKRAEKTASRT